MKNKKKKEDKEPKDGVLRIYPPTNGAHADTLKNASHAYARGDFGQARRLARGVLQQGGTAEEKDFAEMIRFRTAMDRLPLVVGLGCFALFWLVIYLNLWR